MNKIQKIITCWIGIVFVISAASLVTEYDHKHPLTKPKPLKKPFVIFNKGIYPTKNGYGTACCYQYVDANGTTYRFDDTIDAYQIGDTIK